MLPPPQVWEELAKGGDVPNALLSKSAVLGQPFADLMASSGMSESKSAARRLIKGGGASYNGVKITDEAQVRRGQGAGAAACMHSLSLSACVRAYVRACRPEQVVTEDCVVEGRVIIMASGKKNKMVVMLE